MNYELCKKLKDAGFPQIFSSKGIDDYVDKNECYYHFGGKNRALVPWLTLLIEACGYGFYNLTRLQPKEVKDKWGAEGTEDEDLYLGNSPEEAVANLWLALQDNKVKV